GCSNEGDPTATSGGPPDDSSNAVCGNGVVEGDEVCDGGVGAMTCADLDPALDSGTLACSSTCELDTTNCSHTPVPTPGTLTNGPACDGETAYFAGSGSTGAIAAVVFTPESYPFVA